MKKCFLLSSIALLLFACEGKRIWSRKDNKGYGYVPIYIDKNDLLSTGIKPSKITNVPGKIYAYGDYIFQNDMGSGVHIINNTNKQNPVKTGFLNIPYNYEIAIKDSFLYANSYTDMLVFDLRNTNNPTLTNRINGVFPMQKIEKFPTESDVYFECVDTSKGAVIGWKKQAMINANCYR